MMMDMLYGIQRDLQGLKQLQQLQSQLIRDMVGQIEKELPKKGEKK